MTYKLEVVKFRVKDSVTNDMPDSVNIFYSYSNLFEDSMQGISHVDMRAAIESALSL